MSTTLTMPVGDTRSPWREKICTTTPSSGERTRASSMVRLALSTRDWLLARSLSYCARSFSRGVFIHREPALLPPQPLLGDRRFDLALIGRLARARPLQGVEPVLLDRGFEGRLLQGDFGEPRALET